MRKSLAAILLSLLVAPLATAADDGIHVKTLENGLRIVVKEDHSKPLAALRIYVRTGGAFEMDFLGCGISHYYEHLLSGGTTSTRTEAESAKVLQELGGQNNAYTTADHTCYHVVTHRDFIAKAISLYGDWMMNNTLDPKEVEREKGVILKEMNKGEDEPSRVLYKLFSGKMFRTHPAGIPNIGYRENFLRLTRGDLVRYYRNHYAPNNAVVSVAGDVDPDEIFRLVEESMSGWERRPVPVVILPKEARQSSPRRVEKEMDVKQPWVRMGWHSIDLFHEDLYALDMVSAVLSQGRASRLFRRVVEEERLTDAITTYSWTPSFMPGVFGVSFQCPTENLDKTIEVVKEEVERVKKGPVTGEELARAKVQVVSEYQLRLQTVENQAEQVGTDLLTTGDPRFSQKYAQRIQAVTPEEVVAAARKYLDPNGLTVAVVRPIGSAGDDVTEEKQVLGKSEVRKERLENGLTLLVKRTPGLAPVAVEAYALAGVRGEPAEKNGVSFLTGRLLLKGTASRSAAEIARQVEERGASIGSQSGNNTIGLSLTLARGERDLPFAADLVADILANPAFPEEEFAKEKKIAAMIAARQDANWQSEILNFMRKELYGSNPYSRPVVGTPASIERLGREDVISFAKAFLVPEGMVVSVAGDVDVERTTELFRTAFSKLGGAGEYTPPAPPAPEWAAKGLSADRFAFKVNEKTQAVLCIAFPGAPYMATEDRAALLIMDAFTSGIGLPSGWFHNTLRGGERSLVYFVHLSIWPFLEAGTMFVYTQTEPKLLKEVYGLLMGQIEKLRRGEFTDEELEIGRAMALVSEPYYSQTVSDVAQRIALAELYGAGYDLPRKFEAAIKKVTREDVMRVVTRYMKHMLVAVTGPEEVGRIVEELKGE